MRDKIRYEWHIECQDENGDIENVDFAASLKEAIGRREMYAASGDYSKVEIALARSEGNDFDGINWRGYAYLLDDGSLEPVFSTYHEDGPANDGPEVPQRFLKEVGLVSV